MSTLNYKKLPFDLTQIFFGILIIGSLLFGSYLIVKPFISGILWAVLIVIPTWPAMLTLTAKLGGRRVLAVSVLIFSLILLVLIPIWLSLTTIFEQRQTLRGWVQDISLESLPTAPTWLGSVPLAGETLVQKWNELATSESEALLKKAAPVANQVLSWFLGKLEGVGLLFLHLCLTVILATILFLQGEQFADWTKKLAYRVGGQRGEQATILAAKAIKAVAMGVVVTALFQAALSAIAFWVAGIPYAVLLAALIFILGVIQLGAGPVLIPTIIWLFWQEQTTTAIIFSVCAAIILSVDNFIRPYLIKKGADLPLLLIFAGVIGGLFGFGIIGLFIGPTVLAVSYTLINAWINEFSQHATAVPATLCPAAKESGTTGESGPVGG
jgi:predicted PurR-regulated permease PerM